MGSRSVDGGIQSIADAAQGQIDTIENKISAAQLDYSMQQSKISSACAADAYQAQDQQIANQTIAQNRAEYNQAIQQQDDLNLSACNSFGGIIGSDGTCACPSTAPYNSTSNRCVESQLQQSPPTSTEQVAQNACQTNATLEGGSCVCNLGYVLDGASCVTYTQKCQAQDGVNAHGDAGGCYCDTGYTWNSSHTTCETVVVQSTSSTNQTPTEQTTQIIQSSTQPVSQSDNTTSTANNEGFLSHVFNSIGHFFANLFHF